jgi:hypothetical protein
MLYRMVSVIGTLRCKPLMQCHNQSRVLCAVLNLCPIWERAVLHIDVLGTRLQCGQSWHVLSVNFRWIREITPVKLLSFLLEVCLDQGNLRAVGWVFDCDRLQTAILQGLEMVHGLFKIERHDLAPLAATSS